MDKAETLLKRVNSTLNEMEWRMEAISLYFAWEWGQEAHSRLFRAFAEMTRPRGWDDTAKEFADLPQKVVRDFFAKNGAQSVSSREDVEDLMVKAVCLNNERLLKRDERDIFKYILLRGIKEEIKIFAEYPFGTIVKVLDRYTGADSIPSLSALLDELKKEE